VRRRRVATAPLTGLVTGLATVLVTALLAACAPSTTVEPDASSSTPPAPTITPTALPTDDPLPRVPVYDPTAPAQPSSAEPVRLVVPSRDIDMRVVPVGIAADGSMGLSENAFEAGWYEYGPAPGAPAGNAVLAAHVDSVLSGIGPFARLRDVRVGSRVLVTDDASDVHRYRVTSVHKIPKDDAPTAHWFARDGAPRLVLVTCGGAWDAKTRHYADNVVVTAEPTGG